jgi:hypothetical protein
LIDRTARVHLTAHVRRKSLLPRIGPRGFVGAYLRCYLIVVLVKQFMKKNFVALRPQKNALNVELKLPQSDELDDKIENAGLDTLEYNKRWGSYRLRLTQRKWGRRPNY